ncbi:uncharacterized protein PV09_02668 [Verruconis gallopava]|uniref:Vacuolar import and degradation protein-domain-containing protein n=1 Tax=Verruconis gallopava TaxID=253628 RepID=A0A0D2AGZ3_9PEZI|nr:uncharacterized protein PV09_02668 [Verruconis gallopava]KIW06188.1 hypothetical protein PV09_02668 [Verruconis gallopava]
MFAMPAGEDGRMNDLSANQQPQQDLSTSHSSYLSALRQIDSISVPDLASTLTNPTITQRALASTAAHRLDDDEGWGLQDFSQHQQQTALRDPQNEWRAQNAASERLRALQEQLRSLQEAHTESRAFLDRSLQHLDSIRTSVGRSDTTDPQQASRSRALADLERMETARGGPDAARRDRLQRVLSRLNRLHSSNVNASSSGSYGENAPTHNSLYDWSPPSLTELDVRMEDEEFDTIRRELRIQMPNHHPEVLRAMAESVRVDLERDRQRSRGWHSSADRAFGLYTIPRAEQSLRSQAILQAVRRHPRFASRSRENIQRYSADRVDRNGVGAASLSRSSETRERYSPTSDRFPWNRRSDRNSGTNDDFRSRLRRSILSDPPSNSEDSSADSIKRAVVYLGNLRRSQSYEDSLGYAVDARFVTKEFFGEKHDDFVLDVHSLAPVTPTSVLARGSKFKGCQRANPDLTPTMRRSIRRWEREFGGWETFQSSSGREFLPRLTLDDPGRPPSSNIPPHAQRAPTSTRYYTPDQWPVEVTVHEVDWDRMTLSATMEAQNVPSYTPFTISSQNDDSTSSYRADSPSSQTDFLNFDGTVYVEPPRSETPQLPPLSAFPAFTDSKPETQALKTITTYLEGEILDFRTHSFITENFSSTAANDATYWRKLEPFRSFTSDDDLFRRLLSREFLNELNETYLLMRWKEKCFVDDPNATHSSEIQSEGQSYEMAEGCGLTISGFYYVCLRRNDGHVEGLYCDPQSSPYQHLVLERSVSESWWWGWEFK